MNSLQGASTDGEVSHAFCLAGMIRTGVARLLRRTNAWQRRLGPATVCGQRGFAMRRAQVARTAGEQYMDAHCFILRRVGAALFAIALAVPAYMAYCIRNNMGCSSSFRHFSVVAVLYLCFGQPGAARLVTSAVAFSLSGILVGTAVLHDYSSHRDFGARAIEWARTHAGEGCEIHLQSIWS